MTQDQAGEAGLRRETLRRLFLSLGVVALFIVLIVTGAYFAHPQGLAVFDEHGPIESASVLLWAFSAVRCVLSAVRVAPTPSWRWCLLWFSSLSILAALRELDIHEMLNPETLGAWGVRYRIDWWISADAPVGVRLLWFLIAVGLLFVLIYPMRWAKDLWQPIRGNLRFMVLLPVALGCLALGFVCDDILREVELIPFAVKRCVEETAELLGAVLFLWSMLLLIRTARTARESV